MEETQQVTYYTLLPGEECLLQLDVLSFDDQGDETSSVNVVSKGLANVSEKFAESVRNFIASMPIVKFLNKIFGKKENDGISASEHSVFVVTNMRCFLSTRATAKALNAGGCCSGSSAATVENYEFLAFPRSVLTEYNSFTCERTKSVDKASCISRCCCGKNVTTETYKTVLTVGLNTKGENSAIKPNHTLEMTIDPKCINSFEEAMSVVATLSKLAQQANCK
ncbi:MAG: hypothetical protein J6W00_03535 [Lentisphaeria bacterium]|nr:hypothetical protein [Lentisphaeria bacterium]